MSTSKLRPTQRHLLSLDNCPTCGGLRYLITRERKKSIDVMVRCIDRSIENRNRSTYKTVAMIKRTMLNPHEKGNIASRDADSLENFKREFKGQLQALVTLNAALEKV